MLSPAIHVCCFHVFLKQDLVDNQYDTDVNMMMMRCAGCASSSRVCGLGKRGCLAWALTRDFTLSDSHALGVLWPRGAIS